MKTYKVWIHVEEIDDARDSYKDIGEPICYGDYTSRKAAIWASNALSLDEQEIEPGE